MAASLIRFKKLFNHDKITPDTNEEGKPKKQVSRVDAFHKAQKDIKGTDAKLGDTVLYFPALPNDGSESIPEPCVGIITGLAADGRNLINMFCPAEKAIIAGVPYGEDNSGASGFWVEV